MSSYDKNSEAEIPRFPGIQEVLGSVTFLPAGIFLLTGPPGAGKTMYSRQFILDGLRDNATCIFISTSMNKNQFELLFSAIDKKLVEQVKLVNPCPAAFSRKQSAAKTVSSVKEIRAILKKAKHNSGKQGRKKGSTRIVVDSLTHMSLLCGEFTTVKFVGALSALLHESESMAICTLENSEQHLRDLLSSFTDGIIEMKLEENGIDGSLTRELRLFSIKGVHHVPRWVDFTISNKGELAFGDQSNSIPRLSCTLCGKVIVRRPIRESDMIFDTQECVDTYRKLASAYGTGLVETGLTSKAFNVSFFFVDIVGLSNPALSVERQIQKIEVLNKLISSSDSFARSSSDKRIILATGDGMAIGFLLNPELPLELSIELHRKLRLYNRQKSNEDHIHVRIGLASGPIYRVTNMNNIQNVWGPGIILARRVMDACDSGHILLADKFAEELIALRDDYRSIIKPVCDVFEIKHGQKIILYSAYSDDFGNPELPARVARVH